MLPKREKGDPKNLSNKKRNERTNFSLSQMWTMPVLCALDQTASVKQSTFFKRIFLILSDFLECFFFSLFWQRVVCTHHSTYKLGASFQMVDQKDKRYLKGAEQHLSAGILPQKGQCFELS